ncbi:hypothetical protein E3Q23_00014 [Wallemia mellicola]|nr:hypothetical protein E3Q23_00014 [Wallemia mellicola]TIC08209.1 hypothetical protein E3Q16_00209 [Wallemia mellicola]TIC47251.1 hypothetical protein E3Q08_00209 [Wallemia mellicola]
METHSPLQESQSNSPKLRSYKHLKKQSVWEPLELENRDEDISVVPLLPSQQRTFQPVKDDSDRNLQTQQSMPILNKKSSIKFTPPGQTRLPNLDTTPSSEKPSRRKHHHKRSLSHAFFSFNDPTVTLNGVSTAKGSAQTSPTKLHSNFAKGKPSKPAPPLTFERSAFSGKKLTFTTFEFVLGCWLWLTGQRCDSLATTGMGYLITFDAISLLSINAFDYYRTMSPSHKLPFGIRRLETLSLFTQVIYLVFTVTYLAKESIEHALISSSEDDYDHQYGIPFPTHSILLSAFLPYFANKYFNNHHALATVTGTFFYNPKQRRTSKFMNNPFSFFLTLFGGLLWLTDELIEPRYHHFFDKFLACLQTISVGWLVYPSLICLARVLLQTAPSSASSQILRDALKEVGSHPRVLQIELPRIFQITPESLSRTLLDEDSVDLTRLNKSGSSFISPEEGKASETECYKEGIMEILQREGISKDKVCLLDPKAEEEIKPEDLNNFSHFVFGGILGDDPPRDRTKELRKYGFPGRHLGARQMSTDTALGTTKRVIVDKKKLGEIDFIDDPTIVFTAQESVDMPYRYLNDGTGKPLMAPGMLEHIRKDLDKSFDF